VKSTREDQKYNLGLIFPLNMSKLPRQRKRKRGEKGPLDSSSGGNVEPPCEIEVKIKF